MLDHIDVICWVAILKIRRLFVINQGVGTAVCRKVSNQCLPFQAAKKEGDSFLGMMRPLQTILSIRLLYVQ